MSQSVVVLQNERLPAATLIGEIRSSTNLLLQLPFEVLTREKQANAQSKFVQTLSRKEILVTALDKAMTGDEHDWSSAHKHEWRSGNREPLLPANGGNSDSPLRRKS